MAGEKAPAFQFYAKDFLSDEAQSMMSLAQVGAYIRLMARCWLEGSIPDDMDRCARLCGEPAATFEPIWPDVRACFDVSPDEPGRLRHGRLDAERQKQADRREQQSTRGKAGAAARYNKHAPAMLAPQPKQVASTALPLLGDSSASSIASAVCNKEHLEPRPKKPAAEPSPVHEFLKWFPEQYREQRHGASYLVNFNRDGPIVKRLLSTVDLERLKRLSKVLLSEQTDDPWIMSTDRGIGVLSSKFNWLESRLAAHEARKAGR